MIWLLLVMLAVRIFDAIGDAKKARDGIQINHFKESLIAFVILAGVTALFYFYFELTWQEVVKAWLIFLPANWLIFDMTFNIARGLKWDYYSTSPKAAITDKVLGAIHGIGIHPIFVKVLALAAVLVVTNEVWPA